jgi:vancomycin resistance protein VanJ
MKRAFRLLRGGILVIIAIYASVILVGFGVKVFVPPDSSAIELIKLVTEIALWLAVPLFLLALILRGYRIALLVGLVVVAFVITFAPYLPRSPQLPAGDGIELRVMTFNSKATVQGLTTAVQVSDADVIAVQELSPEGAEALATLTDDYPYQALHPQPDNPNAGQGVLSRHPIVADEYWEYPDVPHTLGHQRVEVELDDDQIIALYNTHPWPPLGWSTGYNDESHRVVMQDIIRRIEAEALPTLLMGDMNMTDIFGEYQQLSEQLTDSYLEAGDGIGYTFPYNAMGLVPPLLRLDYIWHDDHFASVSAQVQDENGVSDHAPVVAQLIFLIET